jgi:hypothetical protein
MLIIIFLFFVCAPPTLPECAVVYKIWMRKHQFHFPPHAHLPEQPHTQSVPEQPQEQGTPFLKFRHTANPASAQTTIATIIDDMVDHPPFYILHSSFYILHFPGRTIIQTHQMSKSMATAVQKPNPPPAHSMPI